MHISSAAEDSGALETGAAMASQPTSDSGIAKTSVAVRPGSDGLTVEQRNVRDRLVADNKPGSIKHLYVISAYSGQVLIYNTDTVTMPRKATPIIRPNVQIVSARYCSKSER